MSSLFDSLPDAAWLVLGAVAVALLLWGPRRGKGRASRGGASLTGTRRTRYPGDITRPVAITYAPSMNGEADAGEVVWTWVPYEEDHTQGKDRPVLVIGHDGDRLAALQLTSKDHDQDAAQEARWGRYWLDIGSGAWDSRGRPSEVRLDRILSIDPAEVRREGAILDRARFDMVADAVRKRQGW